MTFALYSFFGTLALIPGAFFLVVWSGYKSKAAWAYWFAPIIIGGLTVIFAILLFFNLISILSGNISGLLFALILGYAIFSSVRFVRIHFHPVYQMGYSGHSVYDEGLKLPANEMLAACPTCLAVLAVNPLMLSPEDKCPHCDSPLVLGYEEEELLSETLELGSSTCLLELPWLASDHPLHLVNWVVNNVNVNIAHVRQSSQ